MATTFGSLKATGTMTVVGALTAVAATVTTLVVTTGTVTTLNAGVVNVQPATGSGYVTVESAQAGTATGAFLCVENPADGTMETCAYSGGVLDCNNFSGC